MAYNFSINSGKLIVTLDTESGKFSENINEYLQPNLGLGNDRVFLKEDGLFKQDFVFEAFGDIGGNTAENLVDAYNLLNALIIGISVNSTTQYKVYTALLTQTGTNAPVATVLENTLGGDVVWSYNRAGYYTSVTTNTAFNGKKTMSFIGQTGQNGEDDSFMPFKLNSNIQGNNLNIVMTTLSNGSSTIASDCQQTNIPVEIRVYN